jgi:hypothetical protein
MLAALIRGRQNTDNAHLATATVATLPTLLASTVAKVADVAVAAPAELNIFHRQAPPEPPSNEAPTLPLPPMEITRAGIVYIGGMAARCTFWGCKSTDLWQSRHGVTICRRCHPPAPGAAG